jgi:pimeloyl-ACP methyl ester carboxylesterase
MQDMRFARLADGQEIAYRQWSDNAGPVILHTHGATAPLELLGEEPMYDRFLRTLGQCGRLVLFDKPGIGASDRFDPNRGYLDQLANAYLAVLTALGVPAAWVIDSNAAVTAILATTHRPRILGAAILNPLSPATSMTSDARAHEIVE